jgi:hypothetical protein
MHIYAIKNKTTCRLYIGIADDIKLRFLDHVSRLRRGVHKVPLFQEDFDKYGLSDFELYDLGSGSWFDEKYWQAFYQTNDPAHGYNYRDTHNRRRPIESFPVVENPLAGHYGL